MPRPVSRIWPQLCQLTALACLLPLQDVSGGLPVPVVGTDDRVYGMEIDLENAREELRALSGQDEGRKLDDLLGSVGLGGVADQLKDLRLGE